MRQRVVRYLLTGIANSASGWGIIFACLWAGASGLVANAAGYGAGLVLSFTLNRRWVFGADGAISRGEVTRFMAAFLVAYGTNAAVLIAAQRLLGDDSMAAQVPAIAAYMLVFFLLSQRFVFRAPVAG